MPKKKAVKKTNEGSYVWHIVLCSILCIGSWLTYSDSLTNELTNWDDQEYITNNPSIKELSKESIIRSFKSYHMGNYHPLTMISYAIEYNIAGIDPVIYHKTNLYIHLLNAILVYLLVFSLSKNKVTAFITSGIFALHPMHVESVVWAAERKDVLYSFFFLIALFVYHKFLLTKQKQLYIITIVCFLLSLLSKAMAVSLPLVLIAIDYFHEGKVTRRSLFNKLPFFAIALIFGIIAIDAQESAKAIGEFKTYSIVERFLFVNYGLTLYLLKFIAPLDLNAFYDYPLKVNGIYPAIVYASPFIILTFLFLFWKFLRHKKIWRFGILFFLATIVMVLQILPVGGAIISERYTYLPYIGLGFIAASLIAKLQAKNKTIPYIVTLVLLLWFSKISYQRSFVWKDSITLWNDVISKSPNSPKAYNNRGDAYNINKDYNSAIKDLSRSIELKYDYPDAFYNRGLSYYYLGEYDKAISDYTSAISYNPLLDRAYYNRSGTYFTLKEYQKALSDAQQAKYLGYPVEQEYIEALMAGINSLKDK